METLRKAADVLGVLTDSLRSFPEEIQAEICNAMKSYEASDELSENEKLNLMYEYAIGTDKNELARMVNER